MNILDTWDVFKSPKNLKKLGYAIAIFCIVAILVSVICGVVGWSNENSKFNYEKERERIYEDTVNQCKSNIPPGCKERSQRSFGCDTLSNGWSFFGLFCLTDACSVKKKCLNDRNQEHQNAQKRLQEHYEWCEKAANSKATKDAEALRKISESNSLDAGVDKGVDTAIYLAIVLVSVLVFIFVAIPLVKRSSILAINGTRAGVSMANQIYQDKTQYEDGFDYQFFKLFLALQIKILDKVGSITESQTAMIKILYEKCDYKSAKFYTRFTQQLSDGESLDSCIESVRKAILHQNELKVSVIESLLAFTIVCGYDERVENCIQYVAENLNLSKNEYVIIRENMLKYTSKTAYTDWNYLFDALEQNQVFSKNDMMQMYRMRLGEADYTISKSYFKEFFRFIFPLLVKLSYADGVLNYERINNLKNFYSDCGYKKGDFLRLFKSYFADEHDFHFHIMNLQQKTLQQKEYQLYALENVILFVNLCGSPQSQLDMITDMLNDLNISENIYATLKNKYSMQDNGSAILPDSLRDVNKHIFS